MKETERNSKGKRRGRENKTDLGGLRERGEN